MKRRARSPRNRADRVIIEMNRTLEGAAEPAVALTVPLVADARAAGNWDEAH